jgi:hypothetical protein
VGRRIHEKEKKKPDDFPFLDQSISRHAQGTFLINCKITKQKGKEKKAVR